jgi:aconitate hydratase
MNAFDDIRRKLELANGQSVHYYSLDAFADANGVDLETFPYSLRILLEQLLRQQDHPAFTTDHVAKFAAWTPEAPREEFPLMPARVLLQDFTGVPCVVDLAVLRSEMQRMGCPPDQIEPSIPVDLVIDHSLQVDVAGCATAMDQNMAIEFKRNNERYTFLKWGQKAFSTLNVIPPGVGICHQVNMEMLASCVATNERDGLTIAFPDSVVGTDSHTPTINSMGVLGWGVGGIEAEAAMLGQPIPILSPIVTGVKLCGALPAGVTATDAALAVVALLREYGVVGHFVEFFGPGLDSLTLADRAPLANMAPEYGATMGFFPVDNATLDYLRNTGRSEDQIDLVERYCKAQGLFRDDARAISYSNLLELDLSTVRASVAGPKRPQDKIWIGDLQHAFKEALSAPQGDRGFGVAPEALACSVELPGKGTLTHGSVVIAAITSCTNTSNPALLLSAGLVARKAVARGLKVPAFVKTSFAPGSRIAGEFLQKTDLQGSLDALGFQIVGYGCASCIGNSGPLADDVTRAIEEHDLIAGAVLSGNRNFEGRVHALTQANYLCSPPLVVAYALAGRVDIDLTQESLGTDQNGQPVYLADIWPTPEEISELIATADDPALYRKLYGNTYGASPVWNKLPADSDSVYAWDPDSTYIQEPAWVEGAATPPAPLTDIEGAAILGMFGDFVTTDHISPAGAIKTDSPAGQYLIEHGVEPADFNSYGARRGNHEVMVRGTFGNIRLRNKLVDVLGGYTLYHPEQALTTIYDAAMRYAATQTPLVVLAGKMYGAGSSRDWAAKGPSLLGIRAVIAESYERIHRSNLVGMGIMPLEYLDGESAASLGLTGREALTITGIATATPGCTLSVIATGEQTRSFRVLCRIDSPVELDYYRNGGILRYVLRRAAGVATD